jgi:hypothetical protein
MILFSARTLSLHMCSCCSQYVGQWSTKPAQSRPFSSAPEAQLAWGAVAINPSITHLLVKTGQSKRPSTLKPPAHLWCCLCREKDSQRHVVIKMCTDMLTSQSRHIQTVTLRPTHGTHHVQCMPCSFQFSKALHACSEQAGYCQQ